MRIDNQFTVDAPIDRAWQALTDLEGLAPCMPGAQLTGVDGDVYSGKVRIKVGPVISQYAGTAEFVEKDEAGHRAVIRAKGRDSRGAGNASALIDARLRPEGTGTAVTVETDLNITGKIAQFGSGMIKEVSEKLLGQFVTNLETRLHAAPAPGTRVPPAPVAPPAAGPAPAAVPPAPPASAPSGAPGGGSRDGETPARPAAGTPGDARGASGEPPQTLPPSSPGGRPVPTMAAQQDDTGDTPSGPPAPAAASGAGEGPAPDTPDPVSEGTRRYAGAARTAGAAHPVVPMAGVPEHAAPRDDSGTPERQEGPAGPSAPTPADPGASDTPAQAERNSGPRTFARDEDVAPIDLLGVAGGSVYRRLVPVAVAVLVAIGVVVYFLVR